MITRILKLQKINIEYLKNDALNKSHYTNVMCTVYIKVHRVAFSLVLEVSLD